jgi:hypothetical protein
MLSDSTARVDKGFKKILYKIPFAPQSIFGFHPEKLEFKGFRLMQVNTNP